MIETQSLADYLGYNVVSICDRCGISDRRPVPEVVETLGELAIDEVTGALAHWFGCERDPEAERKRCELRVIVTLPERHTEQTVLVPQILRRWRATKADDDLRLADFQEWDAPYAFCRCGHARWLNHKDLRKRFGPDMTLGDLRPHLKCRAGEHHREVNFAISREPR